MPPSSPQPVHGRGFLTPNLHITDLQRQEDLSSRPTWADLDPVFSHQGLETQTRGRAFAWVASTEREEGGGAKKQGRKDHQEGRTRPGGRVDGEAGESPVRRTHNTVKHSAATPAAAAAENEARSAPALAPWHLLPQLQSLSPGSLLGAPGWATPRWLSCSVCSECACI